MRTLIILSSLYLICPLWGQSGGAVKTIAPVRGIIPYGSYSLAETESVDDASGALQLRIPLASLPPGPAGHSADIQLSYSSRLFDVQYSPAPGGNGGQDSFQIKRSTEGGWRYAYGIELRLERRDVIDSSNCASNDELRKKFKPALIMADGSRHELRYAPSAAENLNAYTDFVADGWYDFRPDGFRENPCTGALSSILNGAIEFNWFSIDGSYLRVKVNPDSDQNWENNHWEVWFPDGRKITGGDSNQRIWDRNNNFVEIKNEVLSNLLTTKLEQNIGGATIPARSIQLERNTTTLTDKIYFRAPGGTLQFHTIERRPFQALAKEYSCSDSFPSNYCFLSSTTTVEQQPPDPNRPDRYQYAYEVTKISLANGQSYDFEYNSTASLGGWGEVSKMKLPTGGEVNYSYKLDQSPSGATRPGWRKVLLNSLVQKRVVFPKILPDASESNSINEVEITNFDFLRPSNIGIGWIENMISGPSGEVTKHYLESPSFEPRISKQAGLVRKTILPDGAEIDRFWKENLPSGVTETNSSLGLFMANGYVASEVLSRPIGSSAIRKAKETELDGNGNVTQSRESDWFQGNLNLGGIAPFYLVSSPSPGWERTIRSTFFNSPAINPNSIYNKAFHIRVLRSPQLETILNASGQETKKTELSYFGYTSPALDLFINGNVSQRRDYEIPGGRIFQSTYTYDINGNLMEETDPRGIRSVMTFNEMCGVSNLYPSSIKSAAGSTDQQETLKEYDCWTGLEKKSIFKGNSPSEDVVTIRRYDNYGRETFRSHGQLPAGEAGGSASNIYQSSETQYDDGSRRVVTRSDFDQSLVQSVATRLKRVSIQHFDRMGRLRLSRQLENPFDSETNESVGIRTVHLARFTGTKRVEAVSNPYRVAPLANEPETRGWSARVYNNKGQLEAEEVYEGAAAPSYFGESGAPASTTTYQYAASSTVKRDSSNTSAWLTRRQDPASIEKIEALDGLGRLSVAMERDNLAEGQARTVANAYTYDANDNLVKVRTYKHVLCSSFPCASLPVAAGDGWLTQQRTFTYDSLNRLRSAANPENGLLTYLYDANGNLIWELQNGCLTPGQAGCIQTSMAYDLQNRLLSKTYGASTGVGTSVSATFSYDDISVPFSRSRMTRSSNAYSETKWTQFDVLGNVRRSEQMTGGVSYAFEYQRNHEGALKWMKYPSGREVSVSFDAMGRPVGLTKLAGGGTTPVYLSGARYYPGGQMLDWRLGNNLYEAHVYNKRGQLQDLRLGTTAQGTEKWLLENGFGTSDNNGNVVSQRLTLPGNSSVQSTMKYDERNRLQVTTDGGNASAGCAAAGGTFCQEFGYDFFGNRRLVADRGNGVTMNVPLSFDGSNQITDAGFTYDSRGNLTAEAGGDRYVYDVANRMVLACRNLTVCAEPAGVSEAGKTVYRYDADGRRVARVIGAGTTSFVYDADGQLAAEYGGNSAGLGTLFLTSDHLGSTRVVTNAAAADVWRMDYTPFGMIRSFSTGDPRATMSVYGASAPIAQQFTGQEKDGETGLDFFQARYMASTHGRFLSPDAPLVDQSPGSLLSWNLYGYVRNNPLGLVDPSGNCTKKAGSQYASDDPREPCVALGHTTMTIVEDSKYGGGYYEGAGGRKFGYPPTEEQTQIHDESVRVALAIRYPMDSVIGEVLPAEASLQSVRRVRMNVRKPKLETHPQRDPRTGNANANKTPQPVDSDEVYKKAIPDPKDQTGYTWWGKSASGDIYRYKGSNGVVHFNGSKSSGTRIPSHIEMYLK